MKRDAIHIDGFIARADEEPIDDDEVIDALIAFVEAHGWTFGGKTEAITWTEGTGINGK